MQLIDFPADKSDFALQNAKSVFMRDLQQGPHVLGQSLQLLQGLTGLIIY